MIKTLKELGIKRIIFGIVLYILSLKLSEIFLLLNIDLIYKKLIIIYFFSVLGGIFAVRGAYKKYNFLKSLYVSILSFIFFTFLVLLISAIFKIDFVKELDRAIYLTIAFFVLIVINIDHNKKENKIRD